MSLLSCWSRRRESASPEAPLLAEAYWSLPAAALLKALAAERHGLSEREASARCARHGPNSLKAMKQATAWSLFLNQFRSPLVLILIAASLISLQFWLAAVGITIYFVGLTIGGWLQGEYMLDAAKPFMDSVAVTIPYLKSRSVGGALMLASHLVFVGHVLAMALRMGPARTEPAMFTSNPKMMELAHGE